MLGTASSYPAMHNYGLYYALMLFVLALVGVINVLKENMLLDSFPFLNEKVKKILIPLILLLFPAFLAGYIRVHDIDLHTFQQTQDLRQSLEIQYQKRRICAEGIMFPYLGYTLDLKILSKACVQEKDALAVLIKGKNSFPYNEAQMEQLFLLSKDAVLLEKGPILVVKADSLSPFFR